MANTDFAYVWKTFMIRSFLIVFIIVSYYEKMWKMCCVKNQARIWYEDVFNYFLKILFS